MSWWAISSDDFMAALRRVEEGDDPEAVYAEWYANSDHEDVDRPKRHWWQRRATVVGGHEHPS